MPDPTTTIADALRRAGQQAATTFSRDWFVQTIAPAMRKNGANAEAGEMLSSIVHHQASSGYSGGSTLMYFTVNVSFIESSGFSDDIVI